MQTTHRTFEVLYLTTATHVAIIAEDLDATILPGGSCGSERRTF